MPNCLNPWGVAEKTEGVGGKEKARETHRSCGPGGAEGPTGGRDEEAGGGGKS